MSTTDETTPNQSPAPPSVSPRTRKTRADLGWDALLSHLAYEERELLAPLAAYGFQ